ncbi:MAG: NADH-quinone oxidoreductase subunit H [Zestosphaera sp.]
MDSLIVSSTSLLAAALFALLPPLLDGVERKVKAKIQTRYGPPTVLQTWYDLMKLWVKELKIPTSGESSFLLVSLSLLTAITALYPLAYMIVTLHTQLDPLLLALPLTLVASSHGLMLITSISTSNPFAVIGSYRSMFLTLLNEFGLVSGSVIAVYTGLRLASNHTLSTAMTYLLSLLILSFSTYVGGGRLPFDIHEAEPELASGVLIELSSKLLALYIYTHLLMRYVLTLLMSVAFIAPLTPVITTPTALPVTLLISFILYIAYGIIAVTLGRTRVDIGVKTLFIYYLVTLIVLVIFTCLSI